MVSIIGNKQVLFSCCFVFKKTKQKGGAPSPFDRNFGTKISAKAMQWVTKKLLETFRQGEVNAPLQSQ